MNGVMTSKETLSDFINWLKLNYGGEYVEHRGENLVTMYLDQRQKEISEEHKQDFDFSDVLREMKIHESKIVNCNGREYLVIRVPTGWLYSNSIGHMVFVPHILNVESHVTNHY